MPNVTLMRPIEHDGKTVSAIDIDEPTVGAIEAYEIAKSAGKTETAAMIAMIAYDTRLDEAVLRKIRARDLKAIGEAMRPFVEEVSGANGAASSPTSPAS